MANLSAEAALRPLSTDIYGKVPSATRRLKDAVQLRTQVSKSRPGAPALEVETNSDATHEATGTWGLTGPSLLQIPRIQRLSRVCQHETSPPLAFYGPSAADGACAGVFGSGTSVSDRATPVRSPSLTITGAVASAKAFVGCIGA